MQVLNVMIVLKLLHGRKTMDKKDKTIESLKRQILMMWQGFEDGISGDEMNARIEENNG